METMVSVLRWFIGFRFLHNMKSNVWLAKDINQWAYLPKERSLTTLPLGLKRLSIFAYRLTVNTNNRFIGLTISWLLWTGTLGQWHLQTVLKQRLSPIVISCHSWSSQQPVWRSEAGFSHTSASSRSLRIPAATMLAASSRVTVQVVSFGNLSCRPADNSNLFATPRETAAKFSTVRCASPFEATTFWSAAPQRLFSIQKVSCVLRTQLNWVAHARSWPIDGERHTTSCPRSQETVHFLLETLMSVGRLRAGRNLVLRFWKGKQSDESRISDDRRQSWTDLPRRWSTKVTIDWSLNRLDLSAPSLRPRHTRLLVMMHLNLTGYSLNE